MSLDDLVSVSITAATVTPSKAGFGTVLIAAGLLPAAFTQRTRTFSSLTEMTDFGFAVTHPAYLAATKILSQNPSVKTFKVGKRALPPTQTLRLTVTSATVGEVYLMSLGSAGGTLTDISFTVANATSTAASVDFAEVGGTGDTITRATGSFVTDGFKPGMLLTSSGTSSNNFTGALITGVTATVLTLDTQDLATESVAAVLTAVHTTSSIATYLETLTEAVTGIASTVSSADITLTHASGAGYLMDLKSWSSNLQLKDITSDPGLATDLAAIYAYDTDWYGLALDNQSEAEINAAAAWVEANKKFMVVNSSDYGCEDSGSTTDVMSDIEAAAYARTGVLYSRSQLLSYSGAAWMGKQFTQTPGSDTWKFKTLAGITVDSLSAAARSTILGKHGNCYTATSSVNITEEGWSGSGEFLDVTRFVDWLKAEIQFRVFSAMVNNGKIPYTDAGVDLILSIIEGALKTGVTNGGLEAGTLSVTAPLVADIDSATRATRALTGVRFSGKLAGAIHSLTVTGTLTA